MSDLKDEPNYLYEASAALKEYQFQAQKAEARFRTVKNSLPGKQAHLRESLTQKHRGRNKAQALVGGSFCQPVGALNRETLL
jgi:hypothetical protein